MKRDFIRSKRTTFDSFVPLTIKIEKRTAKSNTGIMQALINVVVYILIFVLFFKNNLQFMGIFIAFMVASVVAQLIIRFGRSIKRSKEFPFFKILKDIRLYKEYLTKVENEIDEYMDGYNHYLLDNLFPSSKLASIIENLSPQLFWRLPFHSDFLALNLGQTNIHYPIQLNYPTFTYSEKDEVLNQFKTTVEKKIVNESKVALPYAFSFRDKKCIAVVNKGIAAEEFIQLVNALILDVATFQSSEEVALCLAYSPDFDLDWTRFLPHVWFNDRRLIFCDSEPEIEFTKLFNEALTNNSKHIVAVIDVDYVQDFRFYDIFNSDCLPDTLSVLFFSQTGNIPSQVVHHVDCSKSDKIFVGKYENYELLLNSLAVEDSEILAKQLFNIRLIDNHTVLSNAIPERLTFFELFGVKNATIIPTATPEENTLIQLHFPVKVGFGNEREDIYIDLTNDGDGKR